MENQDQSAEALGLRPPGQVMRLSRLGSFHQSRLSFMRVLLRRMASERWTFSRPVFKIDDAGIGHAVYSVTGPDRTYSLVAFAHDLPDADRSDRVIAEAWDSTFALFDGVPTGEDIARLSRNVPRQEAGRVTESELTLSRANRSVRLWNHVVERLASGRQPDAAMIDRIGYLMRTTAVYGSGKFGVADRATIAARPECEAPFQVEMLTVFLIRSFARDLVEHLAKVRGGGRAAALDAALARRLGIGNSTGLGMAPFLLNHPQLVHNWITARETAIARVRALPAASDEARGVFAWMLERAKAGLADWHSGHPLQQAKLERLREDVDRLVAHYRQTGLDGAYPWDALLRWAEGELGEDAQEWLASLMLEPYGDLVDDLAAGMADRVVSAPRIDGAMDAGDLRDLIERHYRWALRIDWTSPSCVARAWYVSAEKQEPRLGERHSEPVAPYEQPLAPGRDIASLHAALDGFSGPIAAFLMRHPVHRGAVRRVQQVAAAPYAEIRDNTIDAGLLPIDMLRCKLSFFGATRFDPRSDRWVRISLYGGAPYPQDLADGADDFWPYPPGP